MKVIRTLSPTQAGAQKYYQMHGKRLVAVRYRRDRGRRIITVELIVDERQAPQDGVPTAPTRTNPAVPLNPQEPVALRVPYHATEIRQSVKAQGGRWSKQQKLWYLPRERVLALGLIHCIVEGAYARCMDVDFLF